jgi:hypothetical protein
VLGFDTARLVEGGHRGCGRHCADQFEQLIMNMPPRPGHINAPYADAMPGKLQLYPKLLSCRRWIKQDTFCQGIMAARAFHVCEIALDLVQMTGPDLWASAETTGQGLAIELGINDNRRV